jgi:ornithine cyclodeaminase
VTTLRYLDAAALRRALPMVAAIDAIEGVMRAAADGEASAPVRTVQSIARPGREGFVFLVMPGIWDTRGAAAAKVISYVPDNPAAGRASVQGLAVLLDVETGSARLIADASTLTTIRTGAVVGLATRLLARPRCEVLGLIGTGGIASDLVAGVAAARPFERLLVNDARAEAADSFVARIAGAGGSSPAAYTAERVRDNDEIAARADILVTATSSLQPIVSPGCVRPGTHINAVGNFSPHGRELDGATVAAATRYVDDVDNALEEAGELILAAAEGLIPAGLDGLTGDLQGLVRGAVPARTSDDEITLFKTVGTALSDVAALVAAAEAAERDDLGVLLG